jgi:predicted Zn-dependent protease
MRDYFESLAAAVCVQHGAVDRTSLYFAAESSDFIRFNRAKVRQATHVEQRVATVSVSAGKRRTTGTLTLSGNPSADIAALTAERDVLIAQLPFIPEDDYLLLPGTVVSTERVATGRLPSPERVIGAVALRAEQSDLVGFYAAGPMVRAFADSRGQRNWHSVESFSFEWCLYRDADQAVKSSYAGPDWDDAVFVQKMARAREQEALLARPRKTLAPGDYRVFFSPVAMGDLLGTLSWGGFGLKSMRTGVSSLMPLHRGDLQLHPEVSLTEAGGRGVAPRFQNDGFVKPDAVPLIDSGRVAGTLISPRSAGEYGIEPNGGNDNESPESLELGAGTLPMAHVLQTLGTGVYVSNLHYLNYSDRQASRMTGMTRFACFWVENGELVAPIAVMRFDDSFVRMFGSGLVALTRETELQLDSGTYESRQLSGITTPGAIVEGFRFTL